jgi:hypothetical protein
MIARSTVIFARSFANHPFPLKESSMRLRTILLSSAFLMASLTFTTFALAENEGEATASTEALHAWGVEIEAVQPFLPTVNIFRIRGTRTLWGTANGPRGDVMLSAYIRPGIKHDVLNYINEYQASAGYRQYFWKGLHVEASLDVGAAWGTNKFDGKRYTTATLFLNTNVGYRFGFFEPGGFFEDAKKPSSVGFYAMPQFGVLAGLGVADIGPRGGKPDVFLQGNLVLGLSF